MPLSSQRWEQPWPERTALRRAGVVGALAFLALAVVGFSGGWRHGDLVLDGPGVSLYVRLALEHWRSGGGVPYWLPEMWTGSPVWAGGPSFPVLVLLPFASVLGPDGAVKVATIAAQLVGAWGTYFLARSLWGRTPAAVVAGLFYALHPIFVSHTGLFGHEQSAWVMGSTPWLAWSLRRALRGEGARNSVRYVVLAGLISGFAVLNQAEHAYGLVVLAACLVAVELARGTKSGWSGTRVLIARAAGVVAVALGVVAHWLVPFLSLSKSFLLSPPELVRAFLIEGLSGDLAEEPGAFLTRSPGVSEPVTLSFDVLGAGSFYLGWVSVVLTVVGVALLAREDDDGYLPAILLASALSLWMSTAAVPLASSGLASRGQLVPFAVIGLVSGVLVGAFLRRLRLGPWGVIGGAAAAGLLLVTVPYLTPFLALQRVVPFLDNIRFPRFYTLAVLGLALGAAYPLTAVERWLRPSQPRLAPLVSVTIAVALAGVFMLDLAPYRTMYRAHPPRGMVAYAEAVEALSASGESGRVATTSYADPLPVSLLLRGGRELTVGWPHPVAGKDSWRLTGEAMFTPPGYRDAALGLSGTRFFVNERLSDPDGGRMGEVTVEPNRRALPVARAYNEVFLLGDREVAPELAVALSRRSVGVVAGVQSDVLDGGPSIKGALASPTPCSRSPASPLGRGPVAAEVAMACSVHQWIGITGDGENLPVRQEAGGIFRSEVSGLRGVSVLIFGPWHQTELDLFEVGPDGRSLGRRVARARAGRYDENGLTPYAFDPIASSAGRNYAFVVSCPPCSEVTAMAAVGAQRGPGNLVVRGQLDPDRVAAFSLLYDGVAPAAAPSTTVRATRAGPGRWSAQTSGSRGALVVVAEAYFPGWRAQVDGEAVPVVEADGAFLGVPVGPGRHQVELSYHPPAAVGLGRAITLLTLLACLLLLVVPVQWPLPWRRPPGARTRW